MRVKATTSFSLGGGRDVFAGDVIELDEAKALEKIRRGWVVPAPLPADSPEAEADPEAIVTREPVTANREPRRARGR